MAQMMIWCGHCRRMVEFIRKDHRIYCKECGGEILASYKNGSPFLEENITEQSPDSQSPELMRTGTYER